ncbi:DUF4178 domain-containing protein [Actimicrobium sp. CCI2.3]|nr:DUF4178 domain-containing protein [Actimicrobium sp. CCI2.3]MDY7574907.1 DUF4178 domain-containing protein [Actimicrobium sp. CCI2.3]MEB0023362.1 DUF4178 domain-containing protein [Actimicrobium sp. CCI2.3]
MAVCEYCQTTALKDADSVKNLGRMSDVLEDFSPIQIGTSGVFGGNSFTVIGRIQLRYAAGMWNEWYLMYDDGKVAWLGDSSGLYTLTTENPADDALPTFADIVPGRQYTVAKISFTAAEVREAQCVGGQGELPFQVGQGWQAQVADFRNGSFFLTLDYSDIETKVYTGQSVTLDQLKCQLLRDDDQVKTSAGKFKGKIDTLNCPSCGSSIRYLPGVTAHIICPSCQSQLDAASPKAQVLAAGDRLENVRTTLQLGAQATVSGVEFTLIGVMRRADDEQTVWTEYLMHSPRSGFFWLIETSDGWERANVKEKWPNWTNGDTALLDKVNYTKLYEYRATVSFAAGAFNWRVTAGDKTRVVEFENGQNKLTAEMTAQEMTWSHSSPVAADQIRAWFGKDIKADKADDGAPLKSGTTHKFMLWILALNAIPLLLNFWGTVFYTALALAAVYFPARYLESIDMAEK